MKLTFWLVCLAGLLHAQTPTDPQLLNELRQLRQAVESIGPNLQRTQILLFRLQLEDTAISRATQRLDQAKTSLAALQQRRKSQTEEVHALERELEVVQDPAQKARIPQMIAGIKREMESYVSMEQDAQAREIEAESQMRGEQAKRDALEASLEKIMQK